MKRITGNTYFLWMVLAILGLSVFFIFKDDILPHKAMNLKISKQEALTIAGKFMDEQSVDKSKFSRSIFSNLDEEDYYFIKNHYGADSANKAFSVKNPVTSGFTWHISYYQNLPRSLPQEAVTIRIDQSGSVVFYARSVPMDQSVGDSSVSFISQEEAKELAAGFLEKNGISLTGFQEINSTSKTLQNWSEHFFNWEKELADVAETKLTVRIRFDGKNLGYFNSYLTIPQSESGFLKTISSDRFLINIFSVITLFALTLFLLTVFLKKYHAGEVGVEMAGLYFMIILILQIAGYALFYPIVGTGIGLGEVPVDMVTLMMFLIFSIIVFPFISLSGFAAWSVGESLSREKNSGKLASLDGLLNRKFFTIDAARSASIGVLSAFTLVGLFSALAFGLMKYFEGFTLMGNPNKTVFAYFPAFSILIGSLGSALISEVIFRLFGTLVTSKKIKNKIIAAVLVNLVWALFAFSFWTFETTYYPVSIHFILYFFSGLFFTYLFYRFDLLTTIVSNFVFSAFYSAIYLFLSDAYWMEGLMAAAFVFAPVLFLLYGFVRKEQFEYQPDTTPAHIKRISERERMSKELEIARQVQLKLLPKASPEIAGLDIAGICVPALEVGGDYFDYIQFDTNKLGIVIGDVSGKGVPAAIYMTLTKGIIQSHVGKNISPSEILSKVNSLMYKTIERGTFVSLFYAIIDLEKKTMKYARAGHNPAFYFQSENKNVSLLQPRGIALGLDGSDKFEKHIQEGEMQLSSGDLLVLYTDGFTEAMNKNRDEFGEDRLVHAVQKNTSTAKLVLESVFSEIKSFVKDAPQHDDMTMVVLKMT